MNLGNNIKSLRTAKKMTQEELADLLGTTSKSVSRREQSLTYPDISLLPFIANVFEVTVDELLGVENIKQDEYVKELKKQADQYAMNNDYENELKLWQEAYKKLPNNDEVKVCLISIMNTINIVTNTIKYSNEIVKIAESILEKSTNNNIKINATQCLIDLYSQMDNIEMAEYYCKQLPSDLLSTRNVMETRYLKDGKLLKSIQMNICDFVSEIGRESEFVIYNNRIQTSNEYKKEYLERLIKIEELVFVKDNDYGYHSVSTIFNNIELAKLEIRTTNKEDAVINCFNNILRAADYIINFKPHIIKTPFMNQLECTDICGYSSVLRDLKNNILKELIDNIFKQYKNLEIYQDILGKVNEM